MNIAKAYLLQCLFPALTRNEIAGNGDILAICCSVFALFALKSKCRIEWVWLAFALFQFFLCFSSLLIQLLLSYLLNREINGTEYKWVKMSVFCCCWFLVKKESGTECGDLLLHMKPLSWRVAKIGVNRR